MPKSLIAAPQSGHVRRLRLRPLVGPSWLMAQFPVSGSIHPPLSQLYFAILVPLSNKSVKSSDLYFLISLLLLGTVGSLVDMRELSKLNDHRAHRSIDAK